MIQPRAAVAAQYGYTAQPGAWTNDKEGIPFTYLTDVWELFTEKDGIRSFVLQQALSFAEQAQQKYFIIGGSPCTDLTSASVHGGALGFCGEDSFHYHVYPFPHLSNPSTRPTSPDFCPLRERSKHEANAQNLHALYC